ncbi:MAG TPA: sugar ABC transporter permease [Firmicutes bacterium]|uniref:Sugar ABC transporter permease n=1 Tax=Capillibacterium thermochitinicola TaxID=2699427 RepID=A0A8J6LLF9_9FIRM|nr:sugar ABC transporter permease [Capillibacterium thermochitinicola]MBA2132364.1 sugar ABC transporter permease [Capillibacterium thermochitinicola]HHW11447.1 sugar ABC transporter permease [Bacillota bacterium]
MVLPLILFILGFTLLPVLQCIYYSFQDPNTGDFPTLNNYRVIVGSRKFGDALKNTIVVTLIGLTLEMSVGMMVAVLLTTKSRFRGIFRAITMIPMGVPTIVSGVIMLYIFSTNGYLNELLYRLGLIKLPIDWAKGGLRTLFMVAIADMWKVTPLVIILLLSGLESIPSTVYEASAIDGASRTQNFFYITLPLIKPFFTIALIMRAIDAFRIFELPMVLAGRNTMFLGTYAYSEYFDYGNIHTSGAASTILLLVIAVFVFGYILTVGSKEVEQ